MDTYIYIIHIYPLLGKMMARLWDYNSQIGSMGRVASWQGLHNGCVPNSFPMGKICKWFEHGIAVHVRGGFPSIVSSKELEEHSPVDSNLPCLISREHTTNSFPVTISYTCLWMVRFWGVCVCYSIQCVQVQIHRIQKTLWNGHQPWNLYPHHRRSQRLKLSSQLSPKPRAMSDLVFSMLLFYVAICFARDAYRCFYFAINISTRTQNKAKTKTQFEPEGSPSSSRTSKPRLDTDQVEDLSFVYQASWVNKAFVGEKTEPYIYICIYTCMYIYICRCVRLAYEKTEICLEKHL